MVQRILIPPRGNQWHGRGAWRSWIMVVSVTSALWTGCCRVSTKEGLFALPDSACLWLPLASAESQSQQTVKLLSTPWLMWKRDARPGHALSGTNSARLLSSAIDTVYLTQANGVRSVRPRASKFCGPWTNPAVVDSWHGGKSKFRPDRQPETQQKHSQQSRNGP